MFGLFWSIENVYNVPTTCCRLPDYYKQDYHLYICIQTYYHLCHLIYVCHVFIFCTLHFSVYTYVNLFMSSLLIVVFFSILRHTSLIVKKKTNQSFILYIVLPVDDKHWDWYYDSKHWDRQIIFLSLQNFCFILCARKYGSFWFPDGLFYRLCWFFPIIF